MDENRGRFTLSGEGAVVGSVRLSGPESWAAVRARPFRAVVTDLDGTLLDPAGRVTPRTAAALAAARSHGMLLAAASARPLRLIEEVLGEHVGLFDALLASNGASTVAMPHRDVLDEAVVGAAAARQLIGRLRLVWPEAGFGWEVGSRFEHDATFADIARRGGIIRNLDGGPTSAPAHATHQVVVAWPDGQPGERLAAVREVCAVDDVMVTDSAGGVVELSAAGADKAAAMVRWARLSGFDAAGVVAFGDESNDISMLAAAGLGIAMGNARASVKQVASALTLPNTEDGVAAALETLLARP